MISGKEPVEPKISATLPRVFLLWTKNHGCIPHGFEFLSKSLIFMKNSNKTFLVEFSIFDQIFLCVCFLAKNDRLVSHETDTLGMGNPIAKHALLPA